MNFVEAVRQARWQNKKVRQKCWDNPKLCVWWNNQSEHNYLRWGIINDAVFQPDVNMILADDWEIYATKMTLKDLKSGDKFNIIKDSKGDTCYTNPFTMLDNFNGLGGLKYVYINANYVLCGMNEDDGGDTIVEKINV